MTPIEGGCLCGAVRYRSDAPAATVVLCHCTHCQKQSGGAFSINVGVPSGALQLSGTPPARYEDRGSSGLPVWRHFCSQCGSPIFSRLQAAPQLDWVKAGTLDDRSWVRPQVALWCQSELPCVSELAGLPRVDQNPPLG